MALKTPVLAVILDQPDADPITVATDNRDMVRWDLTRGPRKWPTQTEAPMLWLTFLAWAALKRTGQTADEFDVFNDRCLGAEIVAQAIVDPTEAPSAG